MLSVAPVTCTVSGSSPSFYVYSPEPAIRATNFTTIPLQLDQNYGLRKFSTARHLNRLPRNGIQQKSLTKDNYLPASSDQSGQSIFRYEVVGGGSVAAPAVHWPEEIRPQNHQKRSDSSDGSGSRLASIQSQLSELKRQLELELSLERGQVTLGSACSNGSDCRNSIANSHCKLDNFTCSCLPYHVQYNSTTCLPRK